jgi:hypothetical protein
VLLTPVTAIADQMRDASVCPRLQVTVSDAGVAAIVRRTSNISPQLRQR